MFFTKTAPKQDESKKGAYIATLADNYLQNTLHTLNDQFVKDFLRGQFASLKYTLTGYDPTDLTYDEKLKLIALLYELNIKEKGIGNAKSEIEKIGLQIKDRLGVISAFNDGIKDLPDGVFSVHRIEGLPPEQLKEKLKLCIFELDKIREQVHINVDDRTTQLAAEKDVLEAILYNASDGVFALDRAGRIITFNKAMEDLTGYTFNEVELKLADEIIRIFEDAKPLETKVYCAMPGISSEKAAFSSEKITLVARNGGKKYVKMTSTTIQEGPEVNIGCVVTLKDVTKDIELETMKLDFVSIAAHELRTPLTSMRGYLSFLTDDIKTTLDDLHQKYLEKASIAADQLHVLIENLLNISRIERGTLVLEKTSQNWVSLVRSAVDQFKVSASTGKVTLTFMQTKSTIPEVYVDRTMILEVLSNLLENAIRYTPEGGRVTVIVEESNNMVVTHIKDTGIGIPQASIPHLFKKFYRVATVLKEGKKGTGLGLFISKEVVKLHRGEIWVESKEGEGSTFSFSIPEASAE
ncbi:PAS domain-containing protein [candidate division WWE3 bacterium]|nr:PAS domain-containing protein [candidate division WWE3 bacterium]